MFSAPLSSSPALGGRQDGADICKLNIAFMSVSTGSASVTVLAWSHY